MKKITLSFTLFLLTTTYINAQNYQTGIGLRGGFYNGITVKHFISDQAAIEGILTTRWRGFLITGLYEFHKELDASGLKWYYGLGAHVGVWGNKKNPFFENKGGTTIGADGILGLEYIFEEIPFNVSLDWKPAFNIIGYTGFRGDGFALSVRFIF